MRIRRIALCGWLAAATALAPLGCGSGDEPTVPVRGKILRGGLPLNVQQLVKGPLPPGDPGIRVVFTRMGGAKAGEEYQATVDTSSGSFEVPGDKGNGIPVSKYQVTVYGGAYGVTEEKPSGGGRRGGPPGVPPTSGGGSEAPNLMGKELVKKEVDVPAGGVTDLVIEIDEKKK